MKHRLLTCVFILFACLTAVGQVNQVWWSKGRVLHVNPVAGIDSVTYGQFVNADTFLIIIDRASRRIVYDTVDVHVPGMVYHDTIHTTHMVHLNPSRRIGVFSVAKDRQVSFSQGNLQYVQNQNVWKFADQQYEMIGARNVKDGKLANKIDLFGWSGKDSKIPYGVGSSTKYTEYKGDFVDWGTNEINGEVPNTWRTLSIDEWEYIYYERENAQKLIALGTVNDVQGLIILPDNWHLPDGITFVSSVDVGMQWQDGREEGSYFNSSNKDHTKDNIYTEEQWQKMEEAGAVFLPCAGWRSGVNWRKASLAELKTNYVGSYWTSSSLLNNSSYYFFRFTQQEIRKYPFLSNLSLMARGRSVRLVHDTIVPKPSKRIGVFSVAKDRQVSFSQGNLQYIQSRDKWQFANTQYEYMGNRHFFNGQLADTIEYFGWSGKNSNAPWGISLSIELSDYKGEFLDWGTNVISGDVANTWRTLSNDELIYLCQKRENASQLLGLGYIGAISGLIILPDDWVAPEGLQFTPNINDASLNQYTKDRWAIMENAGAVFIPASGYFNHKLDNMRGVNENGYYRVSTLAEDGRQIYLVCGKDRIIYSYSGNNDGNLFYGLPVRLVHDTIVPPPAPCETFKVNGVTFNMMCVEGGTFTWGAKNPKDVRIRKKHQSTVSSFYLGQTPVTQELWQAVMGENPSYYQCDTCMQHPVDSVSWLMAKQFITRLNELTGKHFRLPTEEEWEFAAHGGILSKGFVFTGSDNIDEVAWNRNNANSQTHPVAVLKPNELGLYDMQGNVWEYTQDIYQELTNTYPSVNATGLCSAPYKGNLMVVCGGAYYWGANSFQDEYKITGWMNRGDRRHWTGMRLALSDEDPFLAIDADGYRFHMMLVKGGTFMMGAMEGDTRANANEKPAHEVTLTYDYYIGQTEVTQGLWKAVMGSDNNPSTMMGDDLPVNNVLWEDARAFVYKLNQMTGLSFDLPTEAEWQFAARGGNRSKGYLYAGSDNVGDVAWYSSNSGGVTHTVATKQPNELGIYDMSGNVFEWCSDWLAPYSAEAQVDPKGPISGEYHVYCGGGWYLGAVHCRSSHRRQTTAGYTEAALGFRVVLREKVEPEYVDLGLSVKWATFNLGASVPEEYGDYFAWGETEPKAKYGWAQYKWGNGENKALTKYCNKAAYGVDGFTDYLTQLLPEDDAAHVNWGGNWRMPTAAEFDELINNCTIEKTTMNGANGYLLTSKINGNSIFLPMAGCYNFDLQQDKLYANNSILYYWSADMMYRNTVYTINAYNLSSRSTEDGGLSIGNNTRRCGFPIRPVYEAPKSSKQ